MATMTTYEGFNLLELPSWSLADFVISGGVYEADIDGFRFEISGDFSGTDPSLRVSGVSTWNPEGDLVQTFDGLDVSLLALTFARADVEHVIENNNVQYRWDRVDILDAYKEYVHGLADRELTVDYYSGDGPDFMVGGHTAETLMGGTGRDLIAGGGADDLLYGGDNGDVLRGNIGNDVLYGGNQQDNLGGGRGNDVIYGEAGQDDRYGGRGNDTISGGASHDYLKGSDGDDSLDGGAGVDDLIGGRGDDTLDGGDGRDYLNGGDGSDLIRGGAGNDHISASYDEGKEDTIFGGEGNDHIWTYGGSEVHGGTGDDYVYVEDDGHALGDDGDDFLETWGNATMEGGSGDDTYAVSSLEAVLIEEDDGGTDTIRYFVEGDTATKFLLPENFENANFDVYYDSEDTFEGLAVGNDLANSLEFASYGFWHADYSKFEIRGEGGNDTLTGGFGTDRLLGGNGADEIRGRPGSDTLLGGEGTDTFIYGGLRDSREGTGVDVIEDFEDGDVIDLMRINAVRETEGDEAFTFVGDAAFSGTAGELRFEDGRLEADGTGDREANFAVLLDGVASLSADDLIL